MDHFNWWILGSTNGRYDMRSSEESCRHDHSLLQKPLTCEQRLPDGSATHRAVNRGQEYFWNIPFITQCLIFSARVFTGTAADRFHVYESDDEGWANT
jgi:hypothetical protein